MTEKERLEAERAAINQRLDAIRDQEKKKELPDKLARVGKCYVYRRNCYSCPQKESDYWDTFYRVLAYCEASDAHVVLKTDICAYGKATISTDFQCFALNSLQECSDREFMEALARAQAEFFSGSKVIEYLERP